MPSSESLIQDLCSRIASQALTTCADRADASLHGLGIQLAAIQRQPKPLIQLKGMACLAADCFCSESGSHELRSLLAEAGSFQKLSSHCDVKWLVADVGLGDDFTNSPFSPQILHRLLRRISSEPSEAVWDAMQEGVRLACRMKGKGTDIFGLCFLTAFPMEPKSVQEMVSLKAWPVAAAAGFLLGAADLQTPVVISGRPAISALEAACSLAPAVADSVLLAQPTRSSRSLSPIPTLLQWAAPDPVAVILGLDLCQSAAKVMGSLESRP